MSNRFSSKKHLEFVSGKPCCVCQTTESIQVHHLLKPWDGQRGTGLKSNDRNVVPLCFTHHSELHSKGNELTFFESHGFPSFHGKGVARVLWYQSPAFPHHDIEAEEQLLGWADQVLKEDE